MQAYAATLFSSFPAVRERSITRELFSSHVTRSRVKIIVIRDYFGQSLKKGINHSNRGAVVPLLCLPSFGAAEEAQEATGESCAHKVTQTRPHCAVSTSQGDPPAGRKPPGLPGTLQDAEKHLQKVSTIRLWTSLSGRPPAAYVLPMVGLQTYKMDGAGANPSPPPARTSTSQLQALPTHICEECHL